MNVQNGRFGDHHSHDDGLRPLILRGINPDVRPVDEPKLLGLEHLPEYEIRLFVNAKHTSVDVLKQVPSY